MKPNILFICTDQQRGDALSIENHPVLMTPNMDDLARNDWPGCPWYLDEQFHFTIWTVDRVIRFLHKRDPSAPYFLHVSFLAPHPPLQPPQFYFDRYIRTGIVVQSGRRPERRAQPSGKGNRCSYTLAEFTWPAVAEKYLAEYHAQQS